MSTDSADAHAWVERHLVGWPAATRKLAAELVAKYGRPRGTTGHELIWGASGSWTRMVLYRVGVKHNFPRPHEDVLEQAVNYRVPVEKIADLITYNGSLIVDRTRGELAAHCDSEAQNTIAINIADDIVTGNRTVDEGLAYHAQLVRAMETHVAESYPEKLKFKIRSSAQTADPGSEAQLLRHLGQ
ncbi:MAG TPA: hypothetical protein VMD03_00840 [Steroidobacteraceae bacterium]|nr:hypothetical protein [Steroidobacteraceae bacterium]